MARPSFFKEFLFHHVCEWSQSETMIQTCTLKDANLQLIFMNVVQMRSNKQWQQYSQESLTQSGWGDRVMAIRRRRAQQQHWRTLSFHAQYNFTDTLCKWRWRQQLRQRQHSKRTHCSSTFYRRIEMHPIVCIVDEAEIARNNDNRHSKKELLTEFVVCVCVSVSCTQCKFFKQHANSFNCLLSFKKRAW